MKPLRIVQAFTLVVMLITCGLGMWNGVYRVARSGGNFGPSDVWFCLVIGLAVVVSLAVSILDISEDRL